MRSPKVFCIGLNKTGTSSLEIALMDLGYSLGDQRQAESMFERWVVRDFTWLADFCQTADAFQDAPFSFPFTFVYLDQLFPASRFILTERDTPDQWYESLVRFHGQWGSTGGAPTKEDLLRAGDVFYYSVKHLFGTPDNDLYNRPSLIDYYLRHNMMVKNYFQYRPDDLLILNVATPKAMRNLCGFLKREAPYAAFPRSIPHR